MVLIKTKRVTMHAEILHSLVEICTAHVPILDEAEKG
jgi:hypothetical protein